MDPEPEFSLPIVDEMKDMTVACNCCTQISPFTLRQYEAGPQPVNWQLRLIATETTHHGMPARAWRWDLFCPACAGEMSPRPPGSIRVRPDDT